MSKAPIDYRDPYWSQLADNTGRRLGLPDGLLAAIVTSGERSNANQVSKAGAKTPFQIIPSTRRRAIDKYGVDPYLSPENAAEVAGRLLQDSLRRNNGDVAQAVSEYHGGTNRRNWGPLTRAYTERVTSAVPSAQPAARSGSTFDRVFGQMQEQAQQGPADSAAIANVLKAYQAGRMDPEEKSQFEGDVKSGAIMLPSGATLTGEPERQEPKLLPLSVTDAYVGGKMSPQERADLEADMRAGLIKLPPNPADQITAETAGRAWPTEQGVIERQPEPTSPTLGEMATGAGEAALSTASGLTTGSAGMIVGAGKQLAQNILEGTYGTPEAAQLVQQEAMRGLGAGTYQPRTATGQQYTQAVGDIAENILMPLGPAASELGVIGEAARLGRPQAALAARAVEQAVKRPGEAVRRAVGRPGEAVGRPGSAPTPGTLPSAGAAGTDIAAQRAALAEDLPAPVRLTKGQETREPGQVQFEQEIAKTAEAGAPLRERFSEQHQAIRQSFDAWVDQTGSQAPDLYTAGTQIDKVLRAKAAKAKVAIRVAYKDAEKAGELEQPVGTGPIVATLNDSASAESTAPVLTAARRELIRLGGAANDNGALVPQKLSLSDMEQLRKFVNKTTGHDPTNIKFAGDLKRAIDQTTEGVPTGKLYQKARALRARFADEFENRAVIADLLKNKRGSSDRRVAVENVVDRVLFKGSVEDLRFAGRTLKTAGAEGQQAWHEIQGTALQSIIDRATQNVARDYQGQPIISAAGMDKAIRRLDQGGKLEYLFGKAGAERLHGVNDLMKVLTPAPGTVNTSNTANALNSLVGYLSGEAAVMGITTGLPVPFINLIKFAVSKIRERKLRGRVQAALNKVSTRGSKL